MQDANNLSVRIRSWELLDDNLQPHLGEMTFLQLLQTEIREVISQAKVLHNEQENLKSRLRDTRQRRRELERQGEILRRRVEAHLRGSFGHTSEKLISFGVKPRPRVIRRKPKVERRARRPPRPRPRTRSRRPSSASDSTHPRGGRPGVSLRLSTRGVWELAAVWHEKQAWERFLTPARLAPARREVSAG